MSEETMYIGRLTLVTAGKTKAIFEANLDPNITWGDDQGNRPVSGSRFEVDKKFWELLGCPDEITFGFGTAEGWKQNWDKANTEKEVENVG